MIRPPPALLPAATLGCLLLGLAVFVAGHPGAADAVWLGGLVLCGLPLVVRTGIGLLRGRFAADVVASLAIVTALLLDEPLAGLVIVLMQSGGEALERYAEGRASHAVRELESRAPRLAHRLDGAADGDLAVTDVAAGDVVPGDLLLIRPGELVPCDGVVERGRSHVDVSALTGEPVPITAEPGVRLLSGSLNQEGSLTLRATATASASEYARIVDLVRSAQASKAPIQRLADRYAVWFTPITLAACAVAWILSGDPTRVLAVLVVATPCPLILATPVAIIGGINRAARRGILFRTGGALEQIGGVTAAVLDKTGTLTIGRPEVAQVRACPPFDEREVLRLAAAVEHHSGHLLARSIVDAADAAGLAVPPASGIVEAPGRGVAGAVEGRMVAVGARSWVTERWPGTAGALDSLMNGSAALQAFVAVDGRAAGVIEYADRLRPGAADAVAALRARGLERVVLLSGDSQANADAVARAVGIADTRGDLLPEDKVTAVRSMRRDGHRVLVIGDGTNDAPALSAATVGVALAAHGGGVTAEAADVVLLTDEPALAVTAIDIGRRTLAIARQSLGVGLGLSGAAMVVAALGHIPPVAGALIQEAIDVAVILNALRAAGDPRAEAPAATAGPARLSSGGSRLESAGSPSA